MNLDIPIHTTISAALTDLAKALRALKQARMQKIPTERTRLV